MKKKVLVIIFILVFALVLIFITGNFKTGNIVFESVNQEENDQASEILIGEVLNIITISSDNCFKEKTLEFEITSIEKSDNNLKIGDKINIVFTNIIEPFPYDCTSPVGINYAKIFEKDYLKVYLDKEGSNYILRLQGNSVECMGCQIIKGKCPKSGTRFNINETLDFLKIPKGEKERIEKVGDMGGSYCASDKTIQYYKKINQVCDKDYECESNFCNLNSCSSNIGREIESEQEPETEQPEQEIETSLPTISPFEKLINWFKNIF